MRQSDNVNELYEALSKFQGAMIQPKKDRHVDFTNKAGRRVQYSYADLSSVIDANKKLLSDNGLAVTQALDFQVIGESQIYGLLTKLTHKSGQWVLSFYPLPSPESVDPQTFGSAVTYARRYSYSSITGLSSEEDDDGKTATEQDASGKNDGQNKAPAKTIKNYAPQDHGIDNVSISADFATAKQVSFINKTADGFSIPKSLLFNHVREKYGAENLLKLKKSDVNSLLADLKSLGDSTIDALNDSHT